MTTLVVGGSGKTGRRVAERLADRGVAVRIGSRQGVPPFDWEDHSTWAPSLRGTSAAYIAFYPDLAVPGSAEAISELADVALREGTRRLVLLSGLGEEEAQRAERALEASGADWTVVRCSWFMQNFSEAFMLDGLLAGELALPADGVPAPFVDAGDIADVAVAALTEPGHSGRVHVLTGPRALTFAEAVREIAEASGRDLRFRPLTVEEFSSAAAADGVPPELIGFLGYLFTDVLVEANAGVTDGVRQVLGREARDFGAYARDAAATGVWAA